MREPQDTNEAAGGRSDSTEVLATPTCAVGGIVAYARFGAMAMCADHGCGNKCYHDGECEHKRVANGQGNGLAATNQTKETK